MTYSITIINSEEKYSCEAEQTILNGMVQLGKKGIPVGCKGGGCGICKVAILEGEFSSKKMSRKHISKEEEKQGVVLACRTMPKSDLRLKALGVIKTAILN